jgi:GT2 family glycosyltransferase
MIASVVIPTFNKWSFTRRCLDSLILHTDLSTTEIIVVDNGSSDETVSAIRSDYLMHIRLITNSSNLGFAKASNQGARSARGRYVIFLNNDTETHSSWLELLLKPFHSDEKIGAVGAKLLFPDRTIQHAGVAVTKHAFTPFSANHVHYRQPCDVDGDETKYFDVVTAACLAVRRDCIDEVGLFNEDFVNGYEDIDLCLRIRSYNWLIAYTPRTRVVHYESVSEGRHDHLWSNLELLNRRWSSTWKNPSVNLLQLEPSRALPAPCRLRAIVIVAHSFAIAKSYISAISHTHPSDLIYFVALNMVQAILDLIFKPLFSQNPNARWTPMSPDTSPINIVREISAAVPDRDIILVEHGFRWYNGTLNSLSRAMEAAPPNVVAAQAMTIEVGGMLSPIPHLTHCPPPTNPTYTEHFFDLFLSKTQRGRLVQLPVISGGVVAFRAGIAPHIPPIGEISENDWNSVSRCLTKHGFRFAYVPSALSSDGGISMVRSEEAIFRVRRRTNVHFEGTARQVGLEQAIQLFRTANPLPSNQHGYVSGELHLTHVSTRIRPEATISWKTLSLAQDCGWLAILDTGWETGLNALAELLALADTLPSEEAVAPLVIEGDSGQCRGRPARSPGRFFRTRSGTCPCILLTRQGLHLLATHFPDDPVTTAQQAANKLSQLGIWPMNPEETTVIRGREPRSAT